MILKHVPPYFMALHINHWIKHRSGLAPIANLIPIFIYYTSYITHPFIHNIDTFDMALVLHSTQEVVSTLLIICKWIYLQCSLIFHAKTRTSLSVFTYEVTCLVVNTCI